MPAADLSHLSHAPDGTKPWFYFDSDAYLSECLRRGISPPVGSADAYLAHYVNRGSRVGLSPNPFFQEDFYCARYHDVRQAIDEGRYCSGFEHYVCEGRLSDLSPIWCFNAAYYRNAHSDLTEQNLLFGGFPDLYSHYLLVGLQEQRPGNWILQALRQACEQYGFPTRIEDLAELLLDGRKLPQLLSPVFEYSWMKEKYNWGTSVAPGEFIKYYLLNAPAQQLCPSAYFDEPYYLSSDPAIRSAIEAGVFGSGYEHFLLHGIREGRRPFAAFDSSYYFRTHICDNGPNAVPDLQLPFIHFLRFRGKKRLAISPPLGLMHVPEDAGKAIYERRCAINSLRLPDLQFVSDGEIPDVSVLIIARDNYEPTANCIASAVYCTKSSIEVIVFDNGSVDDIQRLPQINPRIRYIREDSNLGFTIAVNRAARLARGRVLVLLNNDAELTPGAIDIALETLARDPSIGAVGAKIIRMHGLLQEAGSIVWRDGTCQGYGRDLSPQEGQANFVRDVDFCSGCFLALYRSYWEHLGGFDEAYAPAYYEETDFCVRIWEDGKRVVYDPRIVLWHYEFGTSSIREEPLALMRRNQRYFAAKHRGFLAKCLSPSSSNIELARLRHVAGNRVLFIEDRVPDPKLGMGFVRSRAVCQVLENLSGLVSVLGLHNTRRSSPLYTQMRAEVLTNVNVANAEEFLRERAGVYDIVWLSRTHNLRYLRRWREACPQFFSNAKVVLDTEAIAATRRAAYAQLVGRSADSGVMLAEELEHLDGVDHICVVNEADRASVNEMLADRRLQIPVSILGHSLECIETSCDFAGRHDVVLAGAYTEPDSPNADAVIWFDREVRPLLAALSKLRFVIAGSGAAAFIRNADLKHDYHVISNPVDMAEVYREARVMIAPTRFAGGIPMKVHEAASLGVPAVMTDLLAFQLGWKGKGIRSSAAEAQPMATNIVAVALDPVAWKHTRDVQLSLIRKDCDPSMFVSTISRVIREGQDDGVRDVFRQNVKRGVKAKINRRTVHAK